MKEGWGRDNLAVGWTGPGITTTTVIAGQYLERYSVNKAPATITISNTTQTYTGSQKSVTCTTAPAGLVVTVTYNSVTTLPVNAGSYSVSATVSDNNYTGTQTSTLTINKADPVITANPAVGEVLFGQKLQSATFTGGTVNPSGGSWSWVTPTTEPPLGSSSQNARFTPADGANYNLKDVALTVSVPNYIKDADGNQYEIVKIGNQYWTKQNLRTTKYNDGAAIKDGNNSWPTDGTPAYCWYNKDPSNKATYGALYNCCLLYTSPSPRD